jgi:acetyl esterase/lipase
MNAQHCTVAEEGFYGTYYPLERAGSKAIIGMIGDDPDDYMARCAVKWLHGLGIPVVTMSPEKKDYGHHSYPVERVESAVEFLKSHGFEKIGVVGASTTGMLALVAASLIPDITLTIALTPPDFVMEGFYRDGLDGMTERPGDFESSLTWRGEQLPFLPYAYRHPEYWQSIQTESKKRKDMVVSRPLFDESERRHPVQEEERIKVENIRGHVVFVGAEDDVLWDTCTYIRRMEARLAERPHTCTWESHLYEHGTHFVFPEGMVKTMLPIGFDFLLTRIFREAKGYTKECRQARIDIDRSIRRAIEQW